MDLPDDLVDAVVVIAGAYMEACAQEGRIRDWSELARSEILEVTQGFISLTDDDLQEVGAMAMSRLIGECVTRTRAILETPHVALDKASIDDAEFEELQHMGRILNQSLNVILQTKTVPYGVDLDECLSAFEGVLGAYSAQIARLKADQ